MGLEQAIAPAATVLSSFMSYRSEKKAGEIAQAGYEANAASLRSESKAVIEAGIEEQFLARERVRRLLASQKVAIAAGGGNIGGSNLILMADTAAQAERDIKMQMRNREVEASRLLKTANIQSAYGQAAKQTANARALSNLFGGSVKLASIYYPYGD